MERAPTPSSLCHSNDNHPMNPPFAIDSQEVPETATELLPATNAAAEQDDPLQVPPEASVTEATVPSPPLIHDNHGQVISNHSHPPNVSPTNHEDDMSAHRKGRWTLDEKVLFLHGLTTYGKGRWKKISLFLPHRSLVQIKSHAQKVLKRQDAGENVYRRLEEHAFRLEGLIKAVFDEQGIRADHMIPQPSPMKKRKGRGASSTKKKPAPSTHNPFYGQDRYAYFSHAVAARSSGFGYPPPPPPHSHASYPPPHPHAPYAHGPPPPHAHPSRAYSPHMFEAAPHPFDAPSRAYSPHPPDASYPHAAAAAAAAPMHGSRANSPYPPEAYYSQHAPPPMHGSRSNSPYPPPEGYYPPHAPQMHASRAYSPHSFEAPVPPAQAPLPHAPPQQQQQPQGAAGDAGGASTAVAAAALCQLMSCAETTEHAPVPVTARSSDTTGGSSNSSLDHDSGNMDKSSSSAASIPSRQVFFPLDPDPAVVAVVERPRNVVSP